MNRETLFRGFHECASGMQKAYYGGAWHYGEWVSGNLLDYPDVNRAYIAAQEYKPSWNAKAVARHTVGQFTNKIDRNERMVFTGDILMLYGACDDKPFCKCFVEWDNHDNCNVLYPYPKENYPRLHIGDFGNYGNNRYYEVIGNIYDLLTIQEA